MDYQLIALIVLAVLLLISGGWIRKLLKEIKDLVDAVVYALEDNQVSKEELLKIIKEASDVGGIVAEIIQLISWKWAKIASR